MKELSTEEKAKRYDEVIKRVKSLYIVSEPMSGCDVIIETLFPEFKESEDERIKKELIYYFKENNAALAFKGISNERILAWLEKQGE